MAHMMNGGGHPAGFNGMGGQGMPGGMQQGGMQGGWASGGDQGFQEMGGAYDREGRPEDMQSVSRSRCRCIFLTIFIGIICLTIGISLLVHFGSSWSDNYDKELPKKAARRLAYTGLFFLLFGILLPIVGPFMAQLSLSC